MAFHDVRLPVDVEQGAVGGPNFNTTIVGMSSGVEYRNADWSDVRGSWDISYGISDKASFSATREFFFARRGKWAGFRFKDWSDFELTAGPMINTVTNGVLGDGTTTTFNLVKIYEPTGPLPYYRKLTRYVAGTLHVFVNGIEVFNFTPPVAGLSTLVFSSPPALNSLVTATTEFDVPCRFDSDKFDITLETAVAGAIGNLTITEIREGGL